MRQRNHLLAFALFALFIACGVFYFYRYAERKPFGVILFVGEGLVSNKLAAARLYDGGADRRLAIDSLPNVALLSTHAADFAVPDAAAAASALACGVKVDNRALSTDPAGQPRATLFELARRRGRATGLVTNGRLTDPTPAAFYAHTADCRDRAPLALQLAERAGLDVIFGGGSTDFVPEAAHGQRRDGRDLTREMARRGYLLLADGSGLRISQPWSNPKLLGFFGAEALRFGGQTGETPAEGSHPPSLSEMTRAAIENLQRRAGGYLLVVDAGLISRASQANDGEGALRELLELDHAVAVALQYAGAKTLVLVAGGEKSTGGMTLNGYPLRQDHGVSLLGMNAEGLPSITWATGPNGAQPGPDASPSMAPAAFYAPAAANVMDNALAAGFGPGSERLRGFLDNTFVFNLIGSQL